LAEKNISVKIHSTEEGEFAAAADIELIGKTLEEGKTSFFVSPQFYDGEKMDEGGFIQILRDFDIINLLGERCVSVAKQMNLVSEKGIIRIENIPHAHIYKV
jgi:hypothetical protein